MSATRPVPLSPDSERYVLAARLKPGQGAEAERMLRQGPPFDPAAEGLAGHAAYLSGDSVYLEFEGQAARAKAHRLAREHPVEVSRWQAIVDGLPSAVTDMPPEARCIYRWTV